MDNNNIVISYELHIEDMLHTLNARLAELECQTDLSDFEQGRKLAYIEMMDIINTRHRMILDILEDSECGC